MSRLEDEQSKVETIRSLNDEFRRTFAGGRVMLTRGILELHPEANAHAQLMSEIMRFKDFSEDSDPYHEHDFGALTFRGDKVFWKIDYYDLECCSGSEDPADPNVTTRVLTIMLASEY